MIEAKSSVNGSTEVVADGALEDIVAELIAIIGAMHYEIRDNSPEDAETFKREIQKYISRDDALIWNLTDA